MCVCVCVCVCVRRGAKERDRSQKTSRGHFGGRGLRGMLYQEKPLKVSSITFLIVTKKQLKVLADLGEAQRRQLSRNLIQKVAITNKVDNEKKRKIANALAGSIIQK